MAESAPDGEASGLHYANQDLLRFQVIPFQVSHEVDNQGVQVVPTMSHVSDSTAQTVQEVPEMEAPSRETVTEAQRREVLERRVTELSEDMADLQERVCILEQQRQQQQQRETNHVVPDSPNNPTGISPDIPSPYLHLPPTYHQDATIPPTHYQHFPLSFPPDLSSHTPRPSPPLTPPPG